jgi:hypothetical protein
MSTTLVTNWRKIDASDSKTVDPIVYRQFIGSLMYLINTRPDIIFALNSLIRFMVDPRESTLDCCEACVSLPQRYIGVRVVD